MESLFPQVVPIPLPTPVKRSMPAHFTLVHRGSSLVDYWARTYTMNLSGGRDVILKLGYCRHTACAYYEKCLLLACREDWKSWTCESCVYFLRALMEPGAWPPRVEPSPWWHPRAGKDEDGISLLLPGKDPSKDANAEFEKLLECEREKQKRAATPRRHRRRYHKSKLQKMLGAK